MITDKERVLVIGAQGYLGTFLMGLLKDYGYECQGIDTGFFKHGIISDISADQEIIKKDARSLDEKDIMGFDVCIQLAAVSNDPLGNISESDVYDPTRDYALKIAHICKKFGVRYIFPSSCSVYGAAKGLGALTENSQTNPQTGYSLNKLQIEEDLSKISDSSFAPIALRFGTVFGMSPRIRFDLVINMLCGMALTTNKVILNSDGQAWRPHLDIRDACEAIRCCIEYGKKFSGLTILNVGRNDNNLRIIDLANIIIDIIPGTSLEFLNNEEKNEVDDLIKDRKIQDGVDSRTYKVSFDKILIELPEFECQWTVRSGINHLIEELKKANLTEEIFKQRDFYRLQQIEYLYNSHLLDKHLFWQKH